MLLDFGPGKILSNICQQQIQVHSIKERITWQRF
jgi:hypothetical protein